MTTTSNPDTIRHLMNTSADTIESNAPVVNRASARALRAAAEDAAMLDTDWSRALAAKAEAFDN